jgi:SNF2 family DNA or RNA helicase
MGLGKTIQMLAFLCLKTYLEFNVSEQKKPTLIVVPANIIHQWSLFFSTICFTCLS